MKQNIDNAIAWIKEQPIKGCITGSVMLDTYYEGADIDIFVYDEKSFTKLLFAMHYNSMFTIMDPLEQWKFDQQTNKIQDNFQKYGLTTIKFDYNTCIPVNVILKKRCFDIFSVLASFDMDIISKGYDIETKQTLDLSENLPGKTATWNKWNTSYYDPEMWEISRVLRQLSRCFKYYNRGYNVDLVVEKYINLINKIQDFTNIFSSETFSEKLKVKQENTKIVKQICEQWLITHEMSDAQLEVLATKIKEI
jgi:predicted nucleotidyltransferase